MSDFTIEIEVNSAPEATFAYVTDASRASEWYEAVQTVRQLTEGPTGEGSRYEFTRVLPQGTVVNEVVVSEFVDPVLVTFASPSGPTPFVYRYRIEPSGTGSRITLEGSITGEGLKGPAVLLAPLAGRFFAKGMEKNLENLKARLEA